MIRLGTLFIAITLIVGMTQCKKDAETIAQVPTNNTVTLSLHVGGSTFSGTVNTPTVGKPMYFFFFGGKTPNESLTAGTSTSCTVTISNQMTNLPVISCAASNENYIDGNTTYTVKLLNKCALVKFSTHVSVTPGTPGGVSFTTDSSGEGWVILLPQDAVDGAAVNADDYSGTASEMVLRSTTSVPAVTTGRLRTAIAATRATCSSTTATSMLIIGATARTVGVCASSALPRINSLWA